jgi:hypothetical protein
MPRAIERNVRAKRPLKERLIHELKTFAGMALYLWVVFGLFQLHQQIVLNQYHVPFRLTGLALINAFVLAKVMLIAEDVHLGERFKDRPLIYPIIYKSILFAAVFIAAHVLEEMIGGAIRGKPIIDSFPKIGGGSPQGIIVVAVILAVSLLPFFAWREIDRALGPARLRKLLLNSPNRQ